MYTLFVFLLLPICVFSEAKVNTKLGEIIGKQTNTDDGTSLYIFLGIPYAKPPTGKLRFQEPQPLTEKFKKPYQAISKIKCLQYLTHHRAITGEENCLYLNIHTTSLMEDSNFDVLVFIHGGGFFQGAGYHYSPEYLYEVNKRLVYVTINYRLGPFGFLSTEDSVVPGNNGLKDQVMALEWIQKNIRLFGGNPQKVTIAGMSSGAVSVHLHYLSPMSKHLFSHGISMSGTALSPLIQTKNARSKAEGLARLVDCSINDSTELVECLRGMEGYILLEKLFSNKSSWHSSFEDFGPVIEKGCRKPFLDQHPYHLLRRGNVKNAPWLASSTTAEGLNPAASFVDREDKIQEINTHWNTIAPRLLLFNDFAPKEAQGEISQQIRHAYLQDEAITKENRNKLVNLISDRIYMTNIENAVRLHTAVNKAPVYFYRFDYRGKFSISEILSNSTANLGVSHVDDMIYLLKMEKLYPKEQDSPMVTQMTNIWTTFIQNKVPKSDLIPKWPTIARNIVLKGDLTYVRIKSSTDVKVVSSPDISRRDFWESLPLDELHITGDQHIPVHILRQQNFLGRLLTWWSCHVTRTIEKQSCKGFTLF